MKRTNNHSLELNYYQRVVDFMSCSKRIRADIKIKMITVKLYFAAIFLRNVLTPI